MTVDSLAALRSHLYEAYATQYAGCGGEKATALIYRREIRPLLLYRRESRPLLPPPAGGLAVDIGCGRGELVRLLQLLRGHSVTQNLTLAAREDAEVVSPAERNPS